MAIRSLLRQSVAVAILVLTPSLGYCGQADRAIGLPQNLIATSEA
jgi:hypothetical protein